MWPYGDATVRKHKSISATTALVLAATAVRTVYAIPCAAYDSEGSVAYVFGTPYGDLSLGSNLTDTSAYTSLTNKTGRPDFSGINTQCFVNQFTNGLYVLGATQNSTDTAYIYSFVDQSWSTQRTSGGPDPASYTAILDHDTNVLYAYGNGSISALAFKQDAATAESETIEWQLDAANNAAPFPTNVSYQPVLGAANNHIQFLNTPGAAEGTAYIFVIHFAYWQPESQNFGQFPTAHGQTVTILSNSSAAPSSFAFIPDDGNSTYVINARTNTTTVYPGPPNQTSGSRYGAATNGLLQITANGTIAVLDFGAATPTWTTVDLATVGLPVANASSSAPATASATAVQTGSPSAGIAPAAKDVGSAASHNVGSSWFGIMLGSVLAAAVCNLL